MTGDPLEDELSVAADAGSGAEVRDAVIRFARRAGWIDDRRMDDLRLLVSEIVTNADKTLAVLDGDGTLLWSTTFTDYVVPPLLAVDVF